MEGTDLTVLWDAGIVNSISLEVNEWVGDIVIPCWDSIWWSAPTNSHLFIQWCLWSLPLPSPHLLFFTVFFLHKCLYPLWCTFCTCTSYFVLAQHNSLYSHTLYPCPPHGQGTSTANAMPVVLHLRTALPWKLTLSFLRNVHKMIL